MDSVIKYSYHKRLFILLLVFLWTVILSFIGWFLLSVIICAIISAINVTIGDIAVYALSLLLTPYITFAQISFYEKAAGIADVTVVQEAEVEVKTEE